jgi:hypothetical protein
MPAPSNSAVSISSSVACSATAPARIRHPLAGVEHAGGGLQRLGLRHQRDAGAAEPAVDRAVRTRRLLHRVELLQIARQDDAGDRALVVGDPHRPVDEVAHLRGHQAHVHVLVGHVLEEAQEVDLLLVVAAHRHARRLPDDGHHRLVVGLGVVEPVE